MDLQHLQHVKQGEEEEEEEEEEKEEECIREITKDSQVSELCLW